MEVFFFDQRDDCCQRQAYDNKLHYIDVDGFVFISCSGHLQLVDIKPEVELVTECTAAGEARISKAGELWIPGHHMGDTHFPFVCWVGEQFRMQLVRKLRFSIFCSTEVPPCLERSLHRFGDGGGAVVGLQTFFASSAGCSIL